PPPSSFPTRRSSDLRRSRRRRRRVPREARAPVQRRIAMALDPNRVREERLLEKIAKGGKIEALDEMSDEYREHLTNLMSMQADRSEEHTSELQSPDH